MVNAPKKDVTALIAMKNLIRHLIVPHLKRRSGIENLRKNILGNIESYVNGTVEADQGELEKVKFEEYRRCASCNRKNDKKTKTGCSECGRPICEEHHFPLCPECGGKS